jgi:hypothetical protein
MAAFNLLVAVELIAHAPPPVWTVTAPGWCDREATGRSRPPPPRSDSLTGVDEFALDVRVPNRLLDQFALVAVRRLVAQAHKVGGFEPLMFLRQEN